VSLPELGHRSGVDRWLPEPRWKCPCFCHLRQWNSRNHCCMWSGSSPKLYFQDRTSVWEARDRDDHVRERLATLEFEAVARCSRNEIVVDWRSNRGSRCLRYLGQIEPAEIRICHHVADSLSAAVHVTHEWQIACSTPIFEKPGIGGAVEAWRDQPSGFSGVKVRVITCVDDGGGQGAMMRRSQVENFRLPWLSLFALDPSGRPACWIPFSRRLARLSSPDFHYFPS
jgi:hypothetical protein